MCVEVSPNTSQEHPLNQSLREAAGREYAQDEGNPPFSNGKELLKISLRRPDRCVCTLAWPKDDSEDKRRAGRASRFVPETKDTRACSVEGFGIGKSIKLLCTERCPIFTFTGKKRLDPIFFNPISDKITNSMLIAYTLHNSSTKI